MSSEDELYYNNSNPFRYNSEDNNSNPFRYNSEDNNDLFDNSDDDVLFFDDAHYHEIKAFERVFANPFELKSFDNFVEVNNIFDRKLDEITITDIKVDKFLLLLEERGINGLDRSKVSPLLYENRGYTHYNILALILASSIIGKDGFVNVNKYKKTVTFINKYKNDGINKLLTPIDILRYAKLFEKNNEDE